MPTWLHVSDLHLTGEHSYEQDLILRTLVEAAGRLYRQGRRPDLIFLTGDVAFSGRSEEYTAATRFLDKLRQAVSLDRDRVFVIPGNHDIDRRAARGLARTLANEAESVDFFGPDHPRHHLAKLRAFVQWHDEYFQGVRACSAESACALPAVLPLAEGSVAVLPLNTAIFSLDEADHGKLWVGRRCLQRLLEALADQGPADLTIALLHHPTSWLHDDERVNVEALLQSRADLILRGHLHETEAAATLTGSGACLHLAAGAAYQSRRYPQRALLVTANLGRRLLRVLPLRYEDRPKEIWTVDPSLFPENDRFEGELPLPGAPAPGSGAAETPQARAGDATSLVSRLLADAPHLHGLFRYEGRFVARCDDDEASLALIAAIIDREAAREIQVIGRGPQMVDIRTSHYVAAVAKAIVRGVTYRRILILDAHLPQNGLLWLLLLERFIRSPRYRGKVFLHVLPMPFTHNLNPQFQIVDGTYLHRTTRFYNPHEQGAARQAQSLFAVAPSEEVAQALASYEQFLESAGGRYTHLQIVEFLDGMLNHLSPGDHSVIYHWKLVLDVIGFLDGLGVPALPERGIRFIGCLMPFTFTHLAAREFARESMQDTEQRVVLLPFAKLDDAVDRFFGGSLDYLCLPKENTRIGAIAPPLEDPERLNQLAVMGRKMADVEIPVRFVLAGAYTDPSRWQELVAVEPAYKQMKGLLPEEVAGLPRFADQIVRSNYHAACLAKDDDRLVAITTRDAADHLGLRVVAGLDDPTLENTTTFTVYSRL